MWRVSIEAAQPSQSPRIRRHGEQKARGSITTKIEGLTVLVSAAAQCDESTAGDAALSVILHWTELCSQVPKASGGLRSEPPTCTMKKQGVGRFSPSAAALGATHTSGFLLCPTAAAGN